MLYIFHQGDLSIYLLSSIKDAFVWLQLEYGHKQLRLCLHRGHSHLSYGREEHLCSENLSRALEKSPAGITVGHIHCLVIAGALAQEDDVV